VEREVSRGMNPSGGGEAMGRERHEKYLQESLRRGERGARALAVATIASLLSFKRCHPPIAHACGSHHRQMVDERTGQDG
jgi:hypothetical protein